MYIVFMKKISAVNNNFSFKNTKFYFRIRITPELTGAILLILMLVGGNHRTGH